MSVKSQKEKTHVAILSVGAAVVLTGSKLLIGVITGSLGILSEAIHSGLDLIAAVITYFAVRISDKAPDEDHHYGHGKIENFSAFIETILLLITSVWIIKEAVHRLSHGNPHIDVTIWSYIVVVLSIGIDISRSRALMKVAKKYNSQALEADALHFSTDIWSSVVVLFGLIMANFGWFFADSIAAIAVAFIVIGVSIRLGKQATDVLLDKAPKDLETQIQHIASKISEIQHFGDIRIRNAGADIFVEITIKVEATYTNQKCHEISDKLEKKIQKRLPRVSVHVHIEPV